MGIKQMSMQWMELNSTDQPREGRNMEGEELERDYQAISKNFHVRSPVFITDSYEHALR